MANMEKHSWSRKQTENIFFIPRSPGKSQFSPPAAVYRNKAPGATTSLAPAENHKGSCFWKWAFYQSQTEGGVTHCVQVRAPAQVEVSFSSAAQPAPLLLPQSRAAAEPSGTSQGAPWDSAKPDPADWISAGTPSDKPAFLWWFGELLKANWSILCQQGWMEEVHIVLSI